jgi:cell division septation protein DedD
MFSAGSLRTAKRGARDAGRSSAREFNVRALPLHRKQRPVGRDQRIRVLQMHAPAKPVPPVEGRTQEHAEVLARRRGESSTGTATSLTLGFLVAGAVILAAVAFWSGPGGDASGEGTQATEQLATGP